MIYLFSLLKSKPTSKIFRLKQLKQVSCKLKLQINSYCFECQPLTKPANLLLIALYDKHSKFFIKDCKEYIREYLEDLSLESQNSLNTIQQILEQRISLHNRNFLNRHSQFSRFTLLAVQELCSAFQIDKVYKKIPRRLMKYKNQNGIWFLKDINITPLNEIITIKGGLI